MNTKFEISKDFLSRLQWIRLDDLFNLPYEELPSWVWTSNVVYYCRNTSNGKGYVGETKQCLVNRWRGGGIMNHQFNIENGDFIIYRALRKYTPNKFILSILQCNFESDKDRKQSEIYWIKLLHTFRIEWGYNMTLGGDDCSHMSTEASINKRIETQHILYGKLPWSVAGHEANIELYPDKNGASPQFIEAGRRSEVRKKAVETEFKNYGTMAMDLPESIEKRARTRRINCLFTAIIPIISKMKSEGVIINFGNYSKYDHRIGDRIWRLQSVAEYAVTDGRWTPEMTEIFKDYIPKESVNN